MIAANGAPSAGDKATGAVDPAASTARLVVVGSGTVVPEADRGCACFYVEQEGARVLLDCGPGAMQSLPRFHLSWTRLTDLVISHLHTDHVGAIPELFFAFKHALWPVTRTEPLTVWGPPGTRAFMDNLAAAFGDYMSDLGFPLHLNELEPGGSATLEAGISLATHKTPHTAESQAVRLDAPEWSLGYTGDTGLPAGTAAALGGFFKGVDLLVAECSLTDEVVGDTHLSPTRLAALAREADPGLLLITHVYPQVRDFYDIVGLVREAGFDGPAALAEDGAEWSLAAAVEAA